MSETTQAEAPAMNATARWVAGGIVALALAIVPGLIAWGVASAQIKDARQDIATIERKVEALPALDARLSAEERHTIRTDEALESLRSDSARTAEAVAETSGILKVILKD